MANDKQKDFEKYLETYRKITESLGHPNEKWERAILRQRLEEVGQKLPQSVILSIEAFIRLINLEGIKPDLKKTSIKCLQDIWEMVQIEKITPVMKRDVIDWISVLSSTSKTKDQDIKQKIEESYWRLQRVYRKFKVRPKKAQTEEEYDKKETTSAKSLSTRDISVLTYFVQGGCRSMSQEARFNYDDFMTKCEIVFCLLRQLQNVVQETHKLSRRQRCCIYDHINVARRCFGFDAMDSLKMQQKVEYTLKVFRDCLKENITPPEEVIENFKDEVEMREIGSKNELKKHTDHLFQLMDDLNYMDEWCIQNEAKNWKEPFVTSKDSVIDFNKMPDF